MSADNYLLIDKTEDGFPVFHLFASDDEPDLSKERPMFVGKTRDEALRFVHDWTRENVCEYGYVCTEEVWA